MHPHLLFIYGTLQRGENNYPYWLADPNEAIFVGEAETVHRYPLFVNLAPDFPGCSPCLLNLPDFRPDCPRVQGELFLVSARMKAWLDVLEDVAGGTYTCDSIVVQLLHDPARGGGCLVGAEATVLQKGSTVTAAVYFRATGYPAKWQPEEDEGESSTERCPPSSSSRLLHHFSAASCLAAYGARFNGGVPAHLRSPASAKSLQEALNALPEELAPPSSVAFRAAQSTASAPAFYGAPLFPKPIVLFIIDGIGDNTYPELGHRTPLEAVGGVPSCAPPALPVTSTLSLEKISPETQSALRAATPPMDFSCDGINCITQSGASGLMDPYMAGKSCGSDTAHLSMFGYPPHTYYRGRGAYEALGAGLQLDDEDVAFKSNFATIADPDEDGFGDEDADAEQKGLAAAGTSPGDHYVTHRRCDRDFTKEGPSLCHDLNGTTVECDVDGVAFDYPHVIKIQYATEHRCGVALSGAITLRQQDGSSREVGRLSDKITGTDPLKDGRLLLRCKPTVPPSHPEYSAALYTSRLVTAASAKLTTLLKHHPINQARRAHNRQCGRGERKNVANLILFRGAAKKGWVPTFAVRHGLHGLILAPTCIIKGLGICCGLGSSVCMGCDAVTDPLKGATGDYHSDLMVKVNAALHALRLRCPGSHDASVSPDPHYNFVVVHVKGVDDAGHDKSLYHKLEMLRRAGLAMQALWDALPAGSTMAVVADHSTPLGIGDHCCEPVPVSVATKRVQILPVPPRADRGPHSSPPSHLAGGEGAAAFIDGVRFYSEVHAEGGALGRFRGEELLPLLKRANSYYHYDGAAE